MKPRATRPRIGLRADQRVLPLRQDPGQARLHTAHSGADHELLLLTSRSAAATRVRGTGGRRARPRSSSVLRAAPHRQPRVVFQFASMLADDGPWQRVPRCAQYHSPTSALSILELLVRWSMRPTGRSRSQSRARQQRASGAAGFPSRRQRTPRLCERVKRRHEPLLTLSFRRSPRAVRGSPPRRVLP